jgi:hypothetical protein
MPKRRLVTFLMSVQVAKVAFHCLSNDAMTLPVLNTDAHGAQSDSSSMHLWIDFSYGNTTPSSASDRMVSQHKSR